MVGLFDDAKSVYIDGKEVKSIEVVGGGLLYRKIAHNYALSLVANKNNVNYGISDSVTLTATVTDDGDAVADDWVSFYRGNPSVVDGLTQDNNNLVVFPTAISPEWTDDGIHISDGVHAYYNQLLDFVNDEIVIEFDCKANEDSSYALSGQFGMNNTGSNYNGQLFINVDGAYYFFEGSGTIPSNLLTDIMHIRCEIKNGVQKFYVNGSLITTESKTFVEDVMYGEYYSSNNYLHLFGNASNQDNFIKNLIITVNGDGEIIGASKTNNNGVATLTHTSQNLTAFDIYAIFNGTSDSVSFGMVHNYNMDLVSSKNSLNHSTNESAVLTATVTDNTLPMADETVLFYNGTVYANPLTVTGHTDFTALYGDGYTVTSSGVGVNNGDRLVHTQLLDMTTNSYVIMFKCTPSQSSRYAVLGHFTTSNGAGNSSTNFNIRNDYIDFFGGGYNVPYGLTFGDEWNIRMEISPSQQSLYIDGNLVGTSTMDLTSATSSSNNYMNLFSFSNDQEFTIRHLGIVANNGGVFYGFYVTDASGEAEYTFVSESAGSVQIIAKWGEQTDSVTLVVS